VVQAAEIDVVRPGIERAAHHRRVEPVVGAVHADDAAVEHLSDGVRVGRVDVLLARQADVAPDERRTPALEEARDAAPDGARCTDHRDHGPPKVRCEPRR
jgi:hypothetical protein